ncbi:TM2 domain-containing protein [Deinococcus fonticola]|uniref:TM2 domain-containing protein n=1 Tax=Deinococcus fonticola TaxID=2528713 RepID=UPI001074A0CC|nr:TM2 domain-containing protein [Deinococcus fonticola]
MTDPKKPDPTPPGNEPSWVDEVLNTSRAAPAPTQAPGHAPLSGPQDLKLPETNPRPAAPPPPPAYTVPTSGDDWVARATGNTAKTPSMPSGPDVAPRPTQSTSEVLSDFMRPIVNEMNSHRASPAQPHRPAPHQEAAQVQTAAPPPTHTQVQTQARPVDAWGDPAQQPVPYSPPQQAYRSGDVSQKKLIAGLLAIFLGSFGVHKFYLGMNNPGIIMLGVNVGSWIVAFVLGFLMFIVGLGLTLPLAAMISSALGLLGLIEGILYLTKSDTDFEREYLIGKKPWL